MRADSPCMSSQPSSEPSSEPSSSADPSNSQRRLHLGCGHDVRAGWINLDRAPGPGIDVVADLDRCGEEPLPFADNSIDEFEASHLLEHLSNPLAFMQELHRVAKPGARAVFSVPHGGSDDAHTDPTHARAYFESSWGFFSQPFYWRADYGYRGDWQPGFVLLSVDAERFAGASTEDIARAVHTQRNVVLEMTAVLEAVKPVRPASRELQQRPEVEFQLVQREAHATADAG